MLSSNKDKCSGRWQTIDKLNIKATLDWQILPKTDIFVTEFRTNLVTKGFWYGFSFSSSPDEPVGVIKKICTFEQKKQYLGIRTCLCTSMARKRYKNFLGYL